MPNYYVNDNVVIKVRGTLDSIVTNLSGATITIWDSTSVKRVDAAAMTVTGSDASYVVSTAVTDAAGVYKVECALTFPDNQGVLRYQTTFTILARYP